MYGAVIKKANKSDTSKPIKSLKNLIRKGFDSYCSFFEGGLLC